MPKILIVDDEPDIRETLSEKLSGLKFQVNSVSSAPEAWEAVRRSHYDAIVIDYGEDKPVRWEQSLSQALENQFPNMIRLCYTGSPINEVDGDYHARVSKPNFEQLLIEINRQINPTI